MRVEINSVPMPDKKRRAPLARKKPKYPLAELRAGTDDCILTDAENVIQAKNRLASTINHYKKLGGEGKFKVREVVVDGILRVGVWRTE